ncbi:hypothetical protein ACOKNM_004796, partial [Salmonella enterica subsp. enterica serovar Hartford]
ETPHKGFLVINGAWNSCAFMRHRHAPIHSQAIQEKGVKIPVLGREYVGANQTGICWRLESLDAEP